MKRYQFRLAAVLRLRRAEQEQARLRLAETNLRLKALLLGRDREACRYAELAGRQDAVRADDLLAERQDAELAAARLAQAEQLVAEAATTAAMAQIAWVGAHRRVVALERLEERQRAEHGASVLREEIALVDDLVNARFVAARFVAARFVNARTPGGGADR